jgi:hypothetical protein
MIEIRPATTDEMVLDFLRAEFDAHSFLAQWYTKALAEFRADRASLIERGDLENASQNSARRILLGKGREMLLRDFPCDADWRLMKAMPDEIKGFQYINQQVWIELSGGTRLVADGANNLDQNKEIQAKVNSIADRLHRGDALHRIIVARHFGRDKIVLLEGHHRATAYAVTGLPSEIEVFVGTSAHMDRWCFF